MSIPLARLMSDHLCYNGEHNVNKKKQSFPVDFLIVLIMCPRIETPGKGAFFNKANLYRYLHQQCRIKASKAPAAGSCIDNIAAEFVISTFI
jgi:hypothetical protein